MCVVYHAKSVLLAYIIFYQSMIPRKEQSITETYGTPLPTELEERGCTSDFKLEARKQYRCCYCSPYCTNITLITTFLELRESLRRI